MHALRDPLCASKNPIGALQDPLCTLRDPLCALKSPCGLQISLNRRGSEEFSGGDTDFQQPSVARSVPPEQFKLTFFNDIFSSGRSISGPSISGSFAGPSISRASVSGPFSTAIQQIPQISDEQIFSTDGRLVNLIHLELTPCRRRRCEDDAAKTVNSLISPYFENVAKKLRNFSTYEKTKMANENIYETPTREEFTQRFLTASVLLPNPFYKRSVGSGKKFEDSKGENFSAVRKRLRFSAAEPEVHTYSVASSGSSSEKSPLAAIRAFSNDEFQLSQAPVLVDFCRNSKKISYAAIHKHFIVSEFSKS